MVEQNSENVKGPFKTMPRNPEAKGLEFQSSIYKELDADSGITGLGLICEVYETFWAEKIADALNERDALLTRGAALEDALQGLLDVFGSYDWDRHDAALLAEARALLQTGGA